MRTTDPEARAALEVRILDRRENDRRRQREWRLNNPGYQSTPGRSAKSEDSKRRRRIQDLKDQIFVYSKHVEDGTNVLYYTDLVEKAKERLAALEQEAADV